MPGDLKSPEQSYPYYYDRKYDPGTNPFEPGEGSLKKYIQSMAFEKGLSLSPERIDDLMSHLADKGFLCQNPGDEPFRNEIFKYLDNIKKAGRVASKWLTSTS